MRITVGKPVPIVRGPRPEDAGWGPYQFATPYPCGDRIAVAVHVGEDSIKTYGDPQRWFVTSDKGVTWTAADSSVADDCGWTLPGGDVVRFPRSNSVPLTGYNIPNFLCLTPGTDYGVKAEPGTLPQQDGVTFWGGTVIRAYLADRLPAPLDKKEWRYVRKKADGTVLNETCSLRWPFLTRVVFSDASLNDCHMKGLFPTGVPKVGPDGAVWITAFSGEGHINPENRQYSPYYSAELFRSEDGCRTFTQVSHMEYPADGKRYPYLSGGFSDNEIAFFDDGSMCWFFRSAWYGSTGREWAPMYWARSVDLGRTWSEPQEFSFTGIYPSLCKLACGVTLLCYGRPGTFVTACRNDDSLHWTEPVEVMTAGDRSTLANEPLRHPVYFHDWDGACNNAVLIAADENSALLFNTDFYFPDENGVRRKTPCCWRVTVDMDA